MQSEGFGKAHGADGGALQPLNVCVCVTISLVWVRSRPKKLWKLDDPVSQVSFFAHSGFEKQTSSVGSHAVVLW